jgi:hypothetical protein
MSAFDRLLSAGGRSNGEGLKSYVGVCDLVNSSRNRFISVTKSDTFESSPSVASNTLHLGRDKVVSLTEHTKSGCVPFCTSTSTEDDADADADADADSDPDADADADVEVNSELDSELDLGTMNGVAAFSHACACPYRLRMRSSSVSYQSRVFVPDSRLE